MSKDISKHFSWHEAIYLSQFIREATEADGLTQQVKDNLVVLFNKLDVIRDHFNKPIVIHVAFRSPEYNKMVKGAPNSAHLQGKAVDFHVVGLTCDEVRKSILDAKLLESLDMRMEDLPGSRWTHLDTAPVIKNRYFKP